MGVGRAVVKSTESSTIEATSGKSGFTKDNENDPIWKTSAAYSCQHGYRLLTEWRHCHDGGVILFQNQTCLSTKEGSHIYNKCSHCGYSRILCLEF